MKVFYLIDTLEIGGAEKSLLEILSHFHNTQAVMCHIYLGETLKAAYQKAGIPVISLNITGRYSFVQAACQVSAIVRREQPDLIHTTLFRADVVGRHVGRRLNIPVIGSFVSEPYTGLRWRTFSLERRLKLSFVQRLDGWTARWCRHFTANSQAIKHANTYALGIPSHKVSVIYRGRKPEPFLQVNPQQASQRRKELRLEADDCILLNVGRLLQSKGQAELIQAMPALLQYNPNIRLLIAGEGNYRVRLEELIVALGVGHAVQLLGQCADISVLLQLADVFVFPSHYEGFPGALVEAMFAARPIIASDIPVHCEAIISEQSGLLTKVQETELLIQQIIRLIDNPNLAKQLGQHARAIALNKFDINRIAAEHEELYQNIRSIPN